MPSARRSLLNPPLAGAMLLMTLLMRSIKILFSLAGAHTLLFDTIRAVLNMPTTQSSQHSMSDDLGHEPQPTGPSQSNNFPSGQQDESRSDPALSYHQPPRSTHEAAPTMTSGDCTQRQMFVSIFLLPIARSVHQRIIMLTKLSQARKKHWSSQSWA